MKSTITSPAMLCRCTCLLLALCATSCREQRQPEPSPIFSKESAPDDTVQHYDLPDIQEATLLIGGTLSGPDTYYEYRGQGWDGSSGWPRNLREASG